MWQGNITHGMELQGLEVSQRIGPDLSLAFIGSASAREGQLCTDADAEALSMQKQAGTEACMNASDVSTR